MFRISYLKDYVFIADCKSNKTLLKSAKKEHSQMPENVPKSAKSYLIKKNSANIKQGTNRFGCLAQALVIFYKKT